jgi:hypothetical protein
LRIAILLARHLATKASPRGWGIVQRVLYGGEWDRPGAPQK